MKVFMASVGMGIVLFWAGLSLACETCGCQTAKGAGHEPAAVVDAQGVAAVAAHEHEHEPAAVADGKAAPVALSDAQAAAVAVQAPAAAVEAKAVNAGNTICPVMGGPVSVDSTYNVEYKGKVYNLCCGGCKETFLKDPEAALKKLAELEAPAKK